jgi:hypothetical protein
MKEANSIIFAFIIIFQTEMENSFIVDKQQRSQWSPWENCENKLSYYPYRQRERMCLNKCKGSVVQIANCIGRRYENLSISSRNSIFVPSDCEQHCQKINCAAIQYRNGFCSVHGSNFTLKMANDGSSISFTLPEFTSLLQGIILHNESHTTNAVNILDCITKCQNAKFCDVASINVQSQKNNCRLFQKGKYTVNMESNSSYITWYSRKGLVQNVGLIGNEDSFTIENVNIDTCIDKCLESAECLGIEYLTLGSVCDLYVSITGVHRSTRHRTSWIKISEQEESKFEENVVSW